LEALEAWSTFTVPVPDEGVHELALRSTRPRVELRSLGWVSARLPEAVAAARIRRLLAGDLEGGGLEVAASVRESGLTAEGGEGEAPRADLEGQVNFIERDPQGPDSRLRITIAPGNAAGPVTVTHSQGEATADEPLWSFQRQLQLLPGSDRVAVLVEDLDTGLWGGALAAQLGAIPDSALLGTGEAGEEEIANALMEAEFLPKPKALRLLLPEGEVLQGKVRFQTLVQDGKVARVSFLLDGKEVAKREQPPFEARIQLGRLPRPHTLRAIAYDAAGRELGRDSLSLNEPGGTFRLRILSPEPGKHTGPVDVEADLDIPAGHRLDRVDFSWNDRRLATLYGPPFRQRVYVPQDDPSGFIRVVGTLDDGRVAEDVVFLNEKDFAEKVRVRLVELYTVVTDRQGRPVRGLDASQFVIREDGVEKEVAEFNDAGDLPVTLALNIDSSASMFVKLPDVKAAATEFVRGFLSGRDQALLVDFDTEPRLARELTNNLSRVIDGIEQMRAGGDTHLWESIVFSLLELQGIPGKKAVIVYSDGAEEEESLSYRVCFEFARRLGIPVYLIVLHPGIARGDDVTASTKSFIRKLDRLAEATGGRVHYTPNTRNMTALYRQIDSELRSQVLLAYYTTAAAGDEDTWRSVEVEVKDRQLKARTIAGYFPNW
jgi:VWFA-related protein